MDDSIFVQMHQSLDCLSDVVGGLPLSEESLLPEDIEERGLPDFQDQKNVLILFIKFIKLEAVLVFQEKLDFDFCDQSLH